MILIFLFLFYRLAQSDDKCEIKKLSGLAKFAQTLKKPSESLGHKLYDALGLDEDDEQDPSDDEEDEGLDDYFAFRDLIGPIVFACFYGLFWLILLFWTLCAQFCACCTCYRPKTSKKPSVCLIILFSISSAFLLFSTIVLYLSSSKISKAFTEFVDIPYNFDNYFDNFVGKITDVVTDVFDSVNNSNSQIKEKIDDLISFFESNSDVQKDNAKNAQEQIEKYVLSFRKDKNDQNDDFYNFYNDLQSPSILDPFIENVLDKTTPQIYRITQKMINNADELKDAAKELRNNIQNLDDIDKDISEGRSDADSVISDLGDLSEISSEMTNFTNEANDYNTLANIVLYVIPTFSLLILIAYVLSFIFKCCCSRCLLAWFHCFAFFINLFIILIGAAFALIFGVFHVFCPDLINFLTNVSGISDSMDISKENLTQMFVCDETKSLMELGLDNLLDVSKSLEGLNDVPRHLEEATKISNINTIENNFANFTDGLNLNETVTGNRIILNYQDNLPKLANNQNNNQDKQIILNIKNLIDNSETRLKEPRDLMVQVTSFADKIMPSIDDTISSSENLSNFALNSVVNTNERVGTLTCLDTRCIYTSLHNPICHTVYTGAALWVISATTTIISLMLMSCAICCRRKQFKPVTINAAAEFEGPDQDLAGFTSNDGLL